MNYLLFVLSLVSLSATAAPWVVNPDHSEILFKTTYLNETEVTGRFTRFQGDVELSDDARPSQLELIIQTNSIDTGHRIRDGHLRANDFLKAQQFPEITFRSTAIEVVGAHMYRATGKLTLRGVTKDFSLDFQLNPSVNDTWGYPSRFAKFTGAIKRRDFNISWNKTLEGNLLMLGEVVNFWGTFQLQERGRATPGPKHLIPDTTYIRAREKLDRGELTQAQFDAQYPTLAGSGGSRPEKAAPSLPVPAALPAVPAIAATRSYLWWTSFVFLGLIGFLGTLAGILLGKKKLMESYPERYAETNWAGYLSDFVGIGLLLLFCMAFWEVGWG